MGFTWRLLLLMQLSMAAVQASDALQRQVRVITPNTPVLTEPMSVPRNGGNSHVRRGSAPGFELLRTQHEIKQVPNARSEPRLEQVFATADVALYDGRPRHERSPP
jgi:hypothetical protein